MIRPNLCSCVCVSDSISSSPLIALRARIVLTSRMFVKRGANRELPGKPLLIRKPEQSEAFRNSTQAGTFLSNVFLPFDISGTDDQGQPLQPWLVQLVVFSPRPETCRDRTWGLSNRRSL